MKSEKQMSLRLLLSFSNTSDKESVYDLGQFASARSAAGCINNSSIFAVEIWRENIL